MQLAPVCCSESTIIPTYINSSSSKKIKELPFSDNSLKIVNTLKERILSVIQNAEVSLDHHVHNPIQKQFDESFENFMQTKNFVQQKGMKKFDEWLNKEGDGNWFEKFANFLAKLPLKAARNIFLCFCRYIKMAIAIPCYAIAHPLKAQLKLANILVELIHALLQPETWVKIGSGLVGSSLAQMAITGGFGVISCGIGAGMLIGGMTLGALKATIMAQKGDEWKGIQTFLENQARQIPEDLLTGFLSVMLLEGVHQVMRGCQRVNRYIKHSIADRKEYRTYCNGKVDEFYRNHQCEFSDYDRISYNTKDVSITWHSNKFNFHALQKFNHPNTSFFGETVNTGSYSTSDSVYNYTTEMYETVTSTTEIYETFLGFRISTHDYRSIPMQPLPAPIRLSDNVIPNLGAGLFPKVQVGPNSQVDVDKKMK